jgi:hypothetical protein
MRKGKKEAILYGGPTPPDLKAGSATPHTKFKG